MNKNLNDKYDFKKIEENKYRKWLDLKCFEPTNSGLCFSIVLPPPNVTGILHLGHAWDVSLQDTMIRFKKLNGYRTLWLPGTDHAGIATQTKFEKYLAENTTKTRKDFSREEFINEIMKWKNNHANMIEKQWSKLGLALDYSKQKFTMDKQVNDAVNNVFVKLYNDKLIYKGTKLVNWDVKLQTAISDIEVIHQQKKTCMYYIKYYTDQSFVDYVVVATTRPETMFGDVCIFVNPNDSRYQHLIHKKLYNPANKQWIPVLADEYVEIDFGTGVMKCTPAHDFNDYELALKHNLAFVNIMNPDGTMNEKADQFANLDRLKCRKQLVQKFIDENFIESIDENYLTQIGYSERTNEIVEPFISPQWFIKMKPLVADIIRKQTKNQNSVNFWPKRFNNTLLRWLENIEDWCISRQLWWGHQIPVWYHKSTNEIYVNSIPPKNIDDYIRDESVLDTWFSSGLWPLVTLNWPTKNKLYDDFFPNTMLVTGYDIIFFWVARMMVFSNYLTNKLPFENVYVHGLIRDEKGRKMSKSLGNGIEPNSVIEQYGADTLRLFLTSTSSIGEDLTYSEQKIKSTWNFINKLWNSARYIFNLTNNKAALKIDFSNLSDVSLWILHKLNKTIADVSKNMNEYNFVVSTKILTDFIWNDFCSTYIELTKILLKNEQSQAECLNVLMYVLKQIVIMLHPQCPFVTEEIYSLFANSKQTIMHEIWPQEIKIKAETNVDLLVTIINVIRRIKASENIASKTYLEINLIAYKNKTKYEKVLPFLNEFLIMVNAKILPISNTSLTCDKITEIVDDFTLEIPIQKQNQQAEIQKLKNLITTLENEVLRSKNILSNQTFIAKAPEQKVALEKQKYEKYQDQLIKAKQLLKSKN